MIDVNWNLAPEGAEELVQFENHVTWRKGIKIWCMVQEDWCDYVSDFKAIATRPKQTKNVADAVEQEGEKWTHKTAESEYCRILIDKPDQFGNVVILKEEWGYSDYPLSSLKPIKPTISKAEAWDKVASEDLELSVSVSAIKEQYDII